MMMPSTSRWVARAEVPERCSANMETVCGRVDVTRGISRVAGGVEGSNVGGSQLVNGFIERVGIEIGVHDIGANVAEVSGRPAPIAGSDMIRLPTADKHPLRLARRRYLRDCRRCQGVFHHSRAA